jgi:hypothetical protein
MQQVFINEMRTATEHMRKVVAPEEKLFFISAVHGAAFRIMNIEYDTELAFIHHVMNTAYGMMSANLALVRQGGVNTFPKDIFEKLENELDLLAQRIEQKESTHPVLERISNLAYSTTGNGYYLYLKGLISI